MAYDSPENLPEPILDCDTSSLFDGYKSRLTNIMRRSAGSRLRRSPLTKLRLSGGVFNTWEHRISETHPAIVFGHEYLGDSEQFLLLDKMVPYPSKKQICATGGYVIRFARDQVTSTQYRLGMGTTLVPPDYGLPEHVPKMPELIAGCQQAAYTDAANSVDAIWQPGPFTAHRYHEFKNLVGILEQHLRISPVVD